MDHRLSVGPETPEERQGPPGLLGRPLRACRGALAARRLLPHFGLDLSSPLLLFEKIHGEDAIAFTPNRTLGIRNETTFEAKYPRPTRSRAYASPIPLPRPSQGSLPARAGSPLAGRDLHPLDSESKFHEVIAPPFPFDQQGLVALFVLPATRPGILAVTMMLAVAVLALASPSNAQYVITEIIDSTGDGGGNTLENPPDVTVDSSGTGPRAHSEEHLGKDGGHPSVLLLVAK